MAQRRARAAVYDAPNTPFAIRDYPLRDVHDDEVLVRVVMSTICRSDIHSYHGHRPNPCPGILGHEIIGVIDQLGADIPCQPAAACGPARRRVWPHDRASQRERLDCARRADRLPCGAGVSTRCTLIINP